MVLSLLLTLKTQGISRFVCTSSMITQLRESNDAVAAQEIRWSTPGAELRDGGNCHAGLASFHGSATRCGQFLHCDTISLGACWKGYREALVLVDDCTHEVFTYAMKNKSGKSVADALNQHFLRERGCLCLRVFLCLCMFVCIRVYPCVFV